MSEVSYARPSSTVVLVRPASGEPELFMVRRHSQTSFGDAYAFPGGIVDPEDKLVHEYCRGVSSRDADSRLGVSGEGLDYYSAAIRELFEESGVLLANPDEVAEGPEAARDALNDGSDNWADFVLRNELELQCDALHYVSHWITPPSIAKRYSTRFFVTTMPERQTAIHCGGELTDSCWISANDVLAAGRAGELELHFPTIKTLESIARHKTFDELIDWAASCVEWGVTSMLPIMVERDGKEAVSLPGEIDYPGIQT
ncbi:MAG: NUDIX domain-containing protein [Gammaproteobacteria bacterium]|nr:NUDIX domain-containing protein [Gammaproteobacteria bacterium]